VRGPLRWEGWGVAPQQLLSLPPGLFSPTSFAFGSLFGKVLVEAGELFGVCPLACFEALEVEFVLAG
jgi:hypothetical protein